MIRYLLAFVAGLWLFQFQPRIPDPTLYLVYAGILLGACVWRPLRLPAWLVFGFAWAHGHALLSRPMPIPSLDLTQPVWAVGQVDSLVERIGPRRRFVMAATELQQNGQRISGDWRVRVTWYRHAPALLAGETWRLKLRLRTPYGFSNPGGSDYTRWLYEQGIDYKASVRKDLANTRLQAGRGAGLLRLRQQLIDGMQATDGSTRASALLRALVVGDRGGFGKQDWQTFTATGTNHLVAISGLHVGLVAGLVGLIVAGIWRRIPRLCARWPALQVGALAGGVSAAGYAALAGFSLPTQRAMLMLVIAAVVLLSGRSRHPGLALALALAAVTAWSPVALLSPGLWLSFCAVAIIVWVLMETDSKGVGWRWLRVQLAIGLALMPLLLLFFGKASLIAPVVNLVAVPWFSFVIVPVALLGSGLWLLWPSLGDWLWGIWFYLADVTVQGLDMAATWPAATVTWAVPAPGLVGLAGVGVLLLLAPRGLPGRWLGGVLILPLILRQPTWPAMGSFELTQLDVGQGLALVVRTANHVLVYDAGPRFRSGFDTGETVVLPALRQLGVRQIDTLVISHGDNDHAGGAGAIQAGLPVHRLLSGETRRVRGAQPCLAGQQWQWDGVSFSVLSPDKVTAKGNNASCVLRIDNGRHSVLLTGDIEARTERRLLAKQPLTPVDVVLVPHHGSRSSSTAAFVAATSPSYVLYAAGRNNRWGFPRAGVVTRWRDRGAIAWNSAHDGAVQLHFPALQGAIRVESYRRHRYWHR